MTMTVLRAPFHPPQVMKVQAREVQQFLNMSQILSDGLKRRNSRNVDLDQDTRWVEGEGVTACTCATLVSGGLVFFLFFLFQIHIGF
jgi:hypothetical protein